MIKKFSVLLLVFFSVSVYCQDDFHYVDSICDTYKKPGVPGVSVLVLKDGKVVYRKVAGLANVMQNKPVTPETVFNLASVSKQFTAACIVLLNQKGKLDLDDKLSKYFPDFPSYSQSITLKHLLNHSSGIKDYRVLAFIKGDDTFNYTNAEVRKLLVAQELDFEPGSTFSYSNSGYWFLNQIVEQVSGQSIISFAEENIFKPLKMTSTCFSYKPNSVKNSATGYVINNGITEVRLLDENVIGGGGVLSTVDDLVRWLFEIENKKVLGKAFWDEMLVNNAYEYEKGKKYSMGFFIADYRGKNRVKHGGDVDGFHTQISYFPADKVGVIILSNNDETNTQLLHKAAVDPGFGYSFKPPQNFKPVIKLPAETLEKYAGVYEESPGVALTIKVNDGSLICTQLWDNISVTLTVLNEVSFAFEDVGVSLLFDEIVNDEAQTLYINQHENKMVFKRVEKYAIPDYNSYGGRFKCKSLEVDYTFLVKDHILHYIINDEAIPVGLSENDMLFISQGMIEFHRDEFGNIKGFTLSHERAKNIEFIKI